MTPQTPKSAVSAAWVKFRWPMTLLGVALMGLMAYLFSVWSVKSTYESTLDRGTQVVYRAAQQLQSAASKFLQGNITTTFLAALPELTSTGNPNLELATFEQTEIFRAEDSKRIFWDKIPLGTTLSEIRVPVTYRYHLRLTDDWRIEISGQTCIVHAPAFRPSLPPAIHTDRMEKKSENGWARFNAREQLAGLEKSITPMLEDYAGDPKHVAFVREECRKAVAGFVRQWLLKEDHWRKDRFHTITVLFPEESEPMPVKPTLQLD